MKRSETWKADISTQRLSAGADVYGLPILVGMHSLVSSSQLNWLIYSSCFLAWTLKAFDFGKIVRVWVFIGSGSHFGLRKHI